MSFGKWNWTDKISDHLWRKKIWRSVNGFESSALDCRWIFFFASDPINKLYATDIFGVRLDRIWNLVFFFVTSSGRLAKVELCLPILRKYVLCYSDFWLAVIGYTLCFAEGDVVKSKYRLFSDSSGLLLQLSICDGRIQGRGTGHVP